MKIFQLCFLSAVFLFIGNSIAQNHSGKWGKKETDYRIPVEKKQRDYSFTIDSPGDILLKPLTNAYWFFISDPDGDNCPFNPSCSSFFIESVKETNIIQGVLMFADRFTRDMNIFSKKGKYARHVSGRYHDPVHNYKLSVDDIVINHPGSLIKDD